MLATSGRWFSTSLSNRREPPSEFSPPHRGDNDINDGVRKSLRQRSVQEIRISLEGVDLWCLKISRWHAVTVTSDIHGAVLWPIYLAQLTDLAEITAAVGCRRIGAGLLSKNRRGKSSTGSNQQVSHRVSYLVCGVWETPNENSAELLRL